MKISRRNGKEWLLQKNEDRNYCDECKKQLWISPANRPYCNTNECGKDYVHFSKETMNQS